ncbi:hypothetical protein ACQ4PT_039415 [Festuca glaucescens]
MESPILGSWRVGYTTHKDLDRGHDKSYDGVHHFKDIKMISLLDARGITVAVRPMHDGDLLKTGSILDFKFHRVRIGACLISPPEVRDHAPDVEPIVVSPSMSIHASLAMGLDFSLGSVFKSDVKRKFRSTVHPLGKANHFLLVVSFGRSKFKLDEFSVSLALESCIGGLADDLSVLQLDERVFRFSVSSKQVGFLIYSLKSVACTAFKCYFHLWCGGGPFWRREFDLWQKECNAEWVLVSPNKNRTDRAVQALKLRPRKSNMKSRVISQVKRNLSFATFEAYPACPGYEYPASDVEVADVIQAGYDCPQIRKRVSIAAHISALDKDVQIQFGQFRNRIHDNACMSVSEPSPTLTPVIPPAVAERASLLDQGPAHDDAFEAMIDDMVDQVWSCRHCLSFSHNTMDCVGKVRCKSCFRYGHIKSECWKAKSSMRWVAKNMPKQCALDSRASEPPKGQTSAEFSATEKTLSSAPPPQRSDSMANFPVDPHRFVPAGFHVLEPWGADERPARVYVTAPAAPPKRHESWVIAQVAPRPEGADIDEVLNQVHDHIEQHLHWDVVSFAESAVGLGLSRMADSAIRDLLVAQPPHELGHGRMLTFVRHDEGENFRATVYTRLSWLMILNMPFDYRTEEFIRDAVAKFGKTRGDESPEPDNGIPHPQFFVGPIPPHDNWVPPQHDDWENWQNEAAVHLVPGAGPEVEILVNPIQWDEVEIEDVTDEDVLSDVPIPSLGVQEEFVPFNPLAIVPFVETALQQLLQLNSNSDEDSSADAYTSQNSHGGQQNPTARKLVFDEASDSQVPSGDNVVPACMLLEA